MMTAPAKPTKAQLAAEITALVNQYRGKDAPYLHHYKHLRLSTLEKMRERMRKAVELKDTDPGLARCYFRGWTFQIEENRK